MMALFSVARLFFYRLPSNRVSLFGAGYLSGLFRRTDCFKRQRNDSEQTRWYVVLGINNIDKPFADISESVAWLWWRLSEPLFLFPTSLHAAKYIDHLTPIVALFAAQKLTSYSWCHNEVSLQRLGVEKFPIPSLPALSLSECKFGKAMQMPKAIVYTVIDREIS
jgi:hypothetical protein